MRFISVTDLNGTTLMVNADKITHFHEVPIAHREALFKQAGVLHQGDEPPTVIGLMGKGKLVLRNSMKELAEKIYG